jgi:phenylalanine-4-hydroxylase
MLRSVLRRNASKFEEQYASTGSNMRGGKAREKTALQISLAKGEPGALIGVLQPLAKRGISVRNISNRRAAYNEPGDYTTVFLDVEAYHKNPLFEEALSEIKANSKYLSVTGSWVIPWFPTEIQELDMLDQSTLAAGSDLQDDPENPHPGFHDAEYRERRRKITKAAMSFRYGHKIPEVEYTPQENAAWSMVWDKLTALHPTHACKQFNYIFPRLVEGAGYTRERIPQLQTVSDFLNDATGFTIRPVTGLLSSRDFLNALAFKTFFSTQYIRHYSKPLYTPEPDVIHELMGHAPLFADPDFAKLSQQIGMASLGASDADIEKLARCYWYTVEFGMCMQGASPKVYGAGLLSSFGEMEYSLYGQPQLVDWDPFDAAKRPFPITKYQPLYYVAKDFKDAGDKFLKFAASLDPPFKLEYNEAARKVRVFPRDTESMLSE